MSDWTGIFTEEANMTLTKSRLSALTWGQEKREIETSLSHGGSVAQWLARRTRDPAVAGSIPTTALVAISSVHPSAKWIPGCRQLKCIDY